MEPAPVAARPLILEASRLHVTLRWFDWQWPGGIGMEALEILSAHRDLRGASQAAATRSCLDGGRRGACNRGGRGVGFVALLIVLLFSKATGPPAGFSFSR
jgi:hypothetical protein